VKTTLLPFLQKPITDAIVPVTPGTIAPLALATAVLAFLATLLVAVGLTGGRLDAEFGSTGRQSATLQIMADGVSLETEARAALGVLRGTEGVLGVRMMEIEEQRALLEPWLGGGANIKDLSLPLQIAITMDPLRLDVPDLRRRLSLEAPHAVFEDHSSLYGALAGAAAGLRIFAWTACSALLLTQGAIAFMAARAHVLGSGSAIRTLRLVGARDGWISRILARRMTRSVLLASLAGTCAGLLLLVMLPEPNPVGFYLIAITPTGAGWAAPLVIPAIATALGWLAARRTLYRMIRRWS
jgi:cell division transport system permease protein